MVRFRVVVEKADGYSSAHCPDLPGYVATGDTPAEAEANLREALRRHFEEPSEPKLARPPPEEVFERITRRSKVDLERSAAETLRAEREDGDPP